MILLINGKTHAAINMPTAHIMSPLNNGTKNPKKNVVQLNPTTPFFGHCLFLTQLLEP